MIINMISNLIRGRIAKNRARDAQQNATNVLNQQQSMLDGAFNSNYYGDYMNRSEVQATLNNMQNMMRQQNARSMGMAAMTGATPEALAAMQNNNAMTLGNTYSQIGSNASTWKNNVLNNYINNSMAVNNQRYNQWAQQANDFRNYSQMYTTQGIDAADQLVSSIMAAGGVPIPM